MAIIVVQLDTNAKTMNMTINGQPVRSLFFKIGRDMLIDGSSEVDFVCLARGTDHRRFKDRDRFFLSSEGDIISEQEFIDMANDRP